MDIKEINGNKVLHLIDYATRYSVGVRIPSKESSDIINAVFKYWITYFGTVTYFHASSHVKPPRVKTCMQMKASRKEHKNNKHRHLASFVFLCWTRID